MSVQPRSRRPGRTGAARGTHARTSTCTPRIPCQAPASFHLSSREAEKDFVQPRCIRLISGHEMPANKSCSPRVIVVALRSRDALCLRCAALAMLRSPPKHMPAAPPAPHKSASRHPRSIPLKCRTSYGSNRYAHSAALLHMMVWHSRDSASESSPHRAYRPGPHSELRSATEFAH